MALSKMSTQDANAVKLFATEAFFDTIYPSFFGFCVERGIVAQTDKFLGTENKGDEISVPYVPTLSQIGVGSDAILEGNEERLDLGNFKMLIDEYRAAVRVPTDRNINQIRSHTNFKAAAETQLPLLHTVRLEASMFNQLAGVNSTTITVDGVVFSGTNRSFVQGLNSISAPTNNRIIRAGTATNDESLGTSDTFTLSLIDEALVAAEAANPYLTPLKDEEYDLFISPKQFRDLKLDNTSNIRWKEISLNQIAGGGISDGYLEKATVIPVGRSAVGKYANVNIYVAKRVANGEHSSTQAAIPTVSRAVLCGRNAAMFGSKYPLKGNKKGATPYQMADQFNDYGSTLGVEAYMIYGLKKVQFENEDFGSVVISTYAG